MTYKIAIKTITPVTRDVHHFKLEKPADYTFTPGQGTHVSINKEGWRDERRPFTFTSLPEDDYLEFTIKHYPDHEGVTNELRSLVTGDELLIGDPWGAIEYTGPGIFIAGGAGITPFIAILRDIHKSAKNPQNLLIFANKKEEDIILKDELEAIPGLTVHHILSETNQTQYDQGLVTRDFLEGMISDVSQHFYICGPKEMQDQVMAALKDMGADPDSLTFEKQEQ